MFLGTTTSVVRLSVGERVGQLGGLGPGGEAMLKRRQTPRTKWIRTRVFASAVVIVVVVVVVSCLSLLNTCVRACVLLFLRPVTHSFNLHPAFHPSYSNRTTGSFRTTAPPHHIPSHHHITTPHTQHAPLLLPHGGGGGGGLYGSAGRLGPDLGRRSPTRRRAAKAISAMRCKSLESRHVRW